jgi:hypothetical protein
MLNGNLLDTGTVISTDLEHAQEPDELLQLLKHFGFIDDDIAQATGMNERTVRRWKMAGPGSAAANHLAELRNLVLLLRETEALTDRGIVFWMRHPNRLLEDYRPLAVLGAGGFRSVREAALCFSDSERGFNEPISATVLEALQGASRNGGKLTAV